MLLKCVCCKQGQNIFIVYFCKYKTKQNHDQCNRSIHSNSNNSCQHKIHGIHCKLLHYQE